MKLSSSILITASLVGFIGVVLGAFGSHGLKETLENLENAAVWETAVRYQLVHAAALSGLAGYAAQAGKSRLLTAVHWSWAMGVALFSGSLYWLALDGPGFLGPITPIGGLLFLVGWALLIPVAVKAGAAAN